MKVIIIVSHPGLEYGKIYDAEPSTIYEEYQGRNYGRPAYAIKMIDKSVIFCEMYKAISIEEYREKIIDQIIDKND